MRKNKNKGLIAALLCATLVTAVGGYAWLTASDVADSTQSITAGDFSIEFTNEANALMLSGGQGIPMAESSVVGVLTPATFTVHNDGDIKQSVKLQAENITVAGDDVYGVEFPAESKMELAHNKIQVRIYNVADESLYFTGTLADLEGASGAKGVTDMFSLDADASKAFKLYA